MASLKGVNIVRGALGPNTLGNADSICGLLATGVAVAADNTKGILGIALGQTVELHSAREAEAYGIDQTYDTDNRVRVYRHISEFFRMAGDGSTLFLMLYTGTPTDALGDTYGKKMIADAQGSIRVLAVAYTPAQAGAAVDGLDGDVRAAITVAQTFYEWTYETFRPCQIVLEGRDFSAQNGTGALDLRGLEDLNQNVISAYKVSLCIGQDYNYAHGLDAVGKKMADVGTLLGSIASKKVNENIAEVATGNLTNVMKGLWTKAALSNHETIADWDNELEKLDDKGYIFAISYAGYPGLYWNNDHTCTPIIKDSDGFFNEYSISYGRTHDKAVRDLRTKLLPSVKSTQPVDASTGLLPKAIVTYFEKLGDEVFDSMAGKGLISNGKTTVDGESNLLVSPRVLKVQFVIVPTGQIDEIKGTINLKTSI